MLRDPERHLAHYQQMAPLERLREFHEAFGVEHFIDLDKPERDALLTLRRTLITEEFEEVMTEFDGYFDGTGDLVNFAKELADLLVVIFGTAEVLEIPLEAVFVEVMESNMSKLGPDGKPIRREDGKLLKGPNYRVADVEAVLSS